MFIENVSYNSIEKGTHRYPDANTMLIQIVDSVLDFPEPKYEFKITRQYKFADVENEEDAKTYGAGISDEQAKSLVEDLKFAKENDLNVIVHCVAGVCRSGAVAEVGVMMGFDDPKQYRAPNLMVERKMLKVLGWTYDD